MTGRRAWQLGIVLVVSTFVAYWPAIHGGWLWDDDNYVTDDPRMLTLRGLYEIWFEPVATYRHQWYPLTMTLFWVQVQLFGLEPFGFKVVNVLLHAINGVLLWFVARRLRVPGAYWVGLVFAVHPVAVMSVAWVTELKNTLSGLFFLAAALGYLRFAGIGAEDDPPIEARKRSYAVVCVLFALALLSKTAVASLPVGLALILWWKRPRGRVWPDLVPLIPLVLAGLGMVLLTKHFEQHFTGASGDDWTLTGLQRCVLAGQALWFYAAKLVWPDPLVFFYAKWEVDAGSLLAWLAPISVVSVLAGTFVWRDRIGRGAFAAVAFFVVAVAPMKFVNVFMMRYTWVADHWQYWAMMGLLALLVGALHRGLGRLPNARAARSVVLTAIVAAFAARTWVRGEDYRTIETLYLHTLEHNPRSWPTRTNLGNVYLQQERYAEAAECYREAVAHAPDRPELLRSLGTALLRSGDPVEASKHLDRLLFVEPFDAAGHNLLGLAFQSMGRTTLARKRFESSIRLGPEDATPRANLGGLLLELGDVDGAVAELRAAVAIDPDKLSAQANLGTALHDRGDFAGAIASYRRALEIQPGSAPVRSSLARSLAASAEERAASGQFDEAASLQREAIATAPAGEAERYREALDAYERGERPQR